MRGRGRWLCTLLAVCVMTAAAPGGTMEALAAAKTISKVTIYLDLDLTPGEDLPDLEAGEKGDSGVDVYTSNGRYYTDEARWVSSTNREVRIGESYTLKVYLWASDPDESAFKGSYKASNVTVKNGEFVSASRKSNDQLIVTVKTKPVKGEYEAPETAEWKERQRGMAIWEKVPGAEAYDVTLYRGGTAAYKVKAYKGTKLDFYPYMTKEGSYSFKVRAVPKNDDQKDYAKSSDWTESDETYIAKEDVSDGSGQVDYNNTGGGSAINSNTTQVGWISEGNRWWYRYPDGSCHKDSWLHLNNIWYLFDKDGWMLTGWQQKDGRYYYLDPNGAMWTGWVQATDGWYYLNPGPEGVLGAMYQNQWLIYNGRFYRLGENGRMLEGWNQVDGNWYYFYPGEGSMAANTTINTFVIGPDGIWRR